MHVPHVHESVPTPPKTLATELTLVWFQFEVDGLYVDLDLLEVAVAVGAESVLGV